MYIYNTQAGILRKIESHLWLSFTAHSTTVKPVVGVQLLGNTVLDFGDFRLSCKTAVIKLLSCCGQLKPVILFDAPFIRIEGGGEGGGQV